MTFKSKRETLLPPIFNDTKGTLGHYHQNIADNCQILWLQVLGPSSAAPSRIHVSHLNKEGPTISIRMDVSGLTPIRGGMIVRTPTDSPDFGG